MIDIIDKQRYELLGKGNRQIDKASLYSLIQLTTKQQEHRRQKSILIQKIELLESEIMDYHQKQMKNRQLNESIIMSYRQTEENRQSYTQKQLGNAINKHHQEIKKIKQKHLEEKKRLEEQMITIKCQNDKLRLDIERLNLQNEKKIAELKSEYEEKLQEKQIDASNIYHHKLQIMGERLKQVDEMNIFYKNQIEINNKEKEENRSSIKKADKYNQNIDKQNRILSQQSKNNQQSYKILRNNEETLSSLNLRINRALVQLNPSKSKLEERIRQIRNKQY